ncbi:putative oxidoreductase [Streptosporangium becharense]|uniref:Putative oxidoreductase n=1 Tax=Streptosporangium becharense TaxID=1816182 RepID=A0A7W9IL20_9ACTN|nr:DoxX family protein [Streptosporangium becharense]MBB2911535.1 putative oxidoreductase [Streptosporangium becharense]MBB5822647.1 putative oxidoreductase [Streptosporangium becharense]
MLDQVRPYALLIARIALGVIFFVHGWQKFTTMGLAQTAAFFESVGIPLAGVAAPVVATLEVVGGVALILGAALPVFGPLLAITMLGAIVFVHGANGFSADKGGYEFVLALAAGALAIAFSGGGALAVDSLWQRRRAAVTV